MIQIKNRYTKEVMLELNVSSLKDANLRGANLEDKYCYISIAHIGSKKGQLWAIKNSDGVLIYNRGCFSGTKEEFLAAVDKKHSGTKYHDIYYKTVGYIETLFRDKINNSEES